MNNLDRNRTSLLAGHLRRLRTDRGLALQELAERSGISRATLSRIENGEVSPTADTLGRLATAFAMPISHLLSPLECDFEALVPAGRQKIWRDAANGFERKNVSPPSRHLAFEMVEARLAARKTISYSAPAIAGQEHHLVLLEGALTVTVEDEAHTLGPGDCLRYRLLGPSRFETADQGARYILAISQGARR